MIISSKATYFALNLQDKRRRDHSTINIEHQVSQEVYNYYWKEFINIWGKRVIFETIDGNEAKEFLKSMADY